MTTSKSQLNKARKATDVNASAAQREAGNYAKGRIKFKGIDIAIENPKGSTRRGTDPDGKSWSNLQKCDYGYFTGTKAIDGDAIDVFVGPNMDSELIVAIDQYVGGKYPGTFDETKFVIGVDSKKEGEDLYLGNYASGWTLGPSSTCTVWQLRKWLAAGSHKKPFNGQFIKVAGRI